MWRASMVSLPTAHHSNSILEPQSLRKSGLLLASCRVILRLTPLFSPVAQRGSCCMFVLPFSTSINSFPSATRGLAEHYGKTGSVRLSPIIRWFDNIPTAISARNQIIGNYLTTMSSILTDRLFFQRHGTGKRCDSSPLYAH